VKFKKIDFKSDCSDGDSSFCKKLKTSFAQMPSRSIRNYENQCLETNIGIGTLCVMPVITYK